MDTRSATFQSASKFFPTPLQEFQFFDKYSRYDYDLGRRETWVETVTRVVDYLRELSENKLSETVYLDIYDFVLNMKSLPSMRLVAMAGKAARRDNISIYNCSFIPVDSIESFAEALIISMAGCGVGYSVEQEYVRQLPTVQPQSGLGIHYSIQDSTEGWGNAIRFCFENWFNGLDISIDYSLIRPEGTPLKTKGGRASGHHPLKDCLEFAKETILANQGSTLSTLNAHDMMTMVGQAAISGGVRRTAMIALFDFDDNLMKTCKDDEYMFLRDPQTGEYILDQNGYRIDDNIQRWNANNSAVWPEAGLTKSQVRAYILGMNKAGRGEPGIFNRFAPQSPRRKPARFGTNPCGEINLRPREFCNLSIAVARPDDTVDTLVDKIKMATIIGTIQSMATHFPYLKHPDWKKNCVEERLLGVDITGQMDCPLLSQYNGKILELLREVAIETNKYFAAILGINQSVAVTCVKPSGNSSVLLNCSPGLHSRWSKFYIRNVRVDNHSPIYQILKDSGLKMTPDNGYTIDNARTWVAPFPMKSPAGTTRDRSALDQLNYWKLNKLKFTEHNPSVTITYMKEELDIIINWVFDNQKIIGGIAFLPKLNLNYKQPPYEAITEEEYTHRQSTFPTLDFSRLPLYEDSDLTTAAQELACMSGLCEV